MIKLTVLTVCLVLGLSNALDIDNCPKNIMDADQYVHYHNGICYEFVVYARRTFWDADANCKNKGGSLVIIKSRDVNDFIWRNLYYNYRVRSHTWIGLSDVHDEGAFIWADRTNSKYYFTNWGYNQGPHNYYGYDEDCAAIDPRGGAWHDHDCNDYFFTSGFSARYVCQYNAIAPPTTKAPTTIAPTTKSPTTMAPTTKAPTTMAPTTKAPITMAPTTKAPTTMAPTTKAPVPTKLVTILSQTV